ncbi:MAG TPA: O-methyltransferase [Euzebyales bacterium]|nr:O-methyltransferase [Euzebyales bacterium]
MGDDGFAAVDAYLDDLFGGDDPALMAGLARAEAAGLPAINVSSNHGRLLHVLVLARRATRVLEIGTLGGYSAIWMARALPPDGQLVSLEREPAYAEAARGSIECAGLADRVEIRLGRALDSLAELEREGAGPFDMAFIDADKEPYADYLQAVLRLSAPGTLIVADNVVRSGSVARGPSDDPAVTGIQRFNAALAGDPGLAGAIVQMVGTKGHDGMALAVVR